MNLSLSLRRTSPAKFRRRLSTSLSTIEALSSSFSTATELRLVRSYSVRHASASVLDQPRRRSCDVRSNDGRFGDDDDDELLESSIQFPLVPDLKEEEEDDDDIRGFVFDEAKRLSLLFLSAVLEGVSVGPLIKVAIDVDSSILITAFVGTAVAFVCFSVAAMLARRREYIYVGIFGLILQWKLGLTLMYTEILFVRTHNSNLWGFF